MPLPKPDAAPVTSATLLSRRMAASFANVLIRAPFRNDYGRR